jgi:TonB family protein
VKFRIQRDGRITEIELERSSGYAGLDLTAQRALFLTQRVTPLPSAFPDDHLTVHLRFPYQR